MSLFRNVESLSSHFVGHTQAFCVCLASIIIAHLISDFEHGHYILAQTIENLKISQVWMKACQLKVSNFQKLHS